MTTAHADRAGVHACAAARAPRTAHCRPCGARIARSAAPSTSRRPVRRAWDARAPSIETPSATCPAGGERAAHAARNGRSPPVT
ncbi:hypothetical protein AQ906_19030 [Burkholderia pseudomallei]|nr:hypothetical protein SZ29_29310 [Burkholderia pseudomallei]ONB84953.1 hypothetical protein AQ906_19030 [Burkholderia pseudomallei]